MKYFTRGWHSGELDDAETERLPAAYRSRVEQLRSKMPRDIAELSATCLHDSLIDRVVWDPQKRILRMELVCKTDAEGCFGLSLEYEGVKIGKQYLVLLAERARDRRTEILENEVDLDDDGSWVHRILFWPTSEVSIWFASLKLRRSARADRRWDHAGCDPFRLEERPEE